MGDSYRTVITRFRGIAPSGKSFFVDKPQVRGVGTVSIAFSTIHGGDEPKIHALFDGEEITFRLMEWKAEEVGWA